MQTLTCPIPNNINPLQSNGFLFGITKLPEVSFFCQEASIPGLSLPNAEMSTPLVTSKLPGDKASYDDLTITFLIDEGMTNYIAVHNWLVGMGFPEGWYQYADFLKDRIDGVTSSPAAAAVSDGVLQILSSSNNPIKTVRFVDLFPISLTSLQLTSTTSETTYLAGTATFAYSYYKFE